MTADGSHHLGKNALLAFCLKTEIKSMNPSFQSCQRLRNRFSAYRETATRERLQICKLSRFAPAGEVISSQDVNPVQEYQLGNYRYAGSSSFLKNCKQHNSWWRWSTSTIALYTNAVGFQLNREKFIKRNDEILYLEVVVGISAVELLFVVERRNSSNMLQTYASNNWRFPAWGNSAKT